MKSSFLVLGLLCFATILARADDPLLKPFHIEFKGYQQNPADGSYTFSLYFADIPQPHVHWPDGKGEPKTLFKIGDTIGRYKIVDFKVKIETTPRNGLDDRILPADYSELILQNMSKPEEKVSLPYRGKIDAPEAGLPPDSK